MLRHRKYSPLSTALRPHNTTQSFHLLLSSLARQLIRTLADTLIRVALCCPCVCLLLIPPRGIASGIVRLKPLSISCMQARDKTKKKTAMKIAVVEEAVITLRILMSFPLERRRENNRAQERRMVDISMSLNSSLLLMFFTYG